MPLLAFANKPGSKAFTPSVNAFSISIVPQTRSSVAPKGKSTIGILINSVSNFSPF